MENKQNSRPRVSVLMPSYNLAEYLPAAVRSVLAQTFEDFEFLIEDDGSTDGSAAWLARLTDPRVNVVAKSVNEGQNRTTNNLVGRARGEYIALIASDDVWEHDKLAKQVPVLDAQPEVALCMCWPRFIDPDGKETQEAGPLNALRRMGNGQRGVWNARLRLGNAFFGSMPLYRKSVHETQGGFDEPLHLLADLDFWLKCLNEGELYIVQEPLVSVRLRPDNLSNPNAENMKRHNEELATIRARHRPKPSAKLKLAIATPFYEGKGWAAYISSIVPTVAELTRRKVDFDFWQLSGDSYIWRARNYLAQRLVESDFTHLLFIDSDQGWDTQGMLYVVSADVDIVGAAYPVKNNWEQYGVVIETNEPNRTPKVNREGLIYATQVPCGFMKIHRRVFERIVQAEPDNWYYVPDGLGGATRIHNFFGHLIEDHIAYGEDISFCKRALRSGSELFVEPRCDMAHMGAQQWVGNYHKFLCKQPGGSDSAEPFKKQEAA